VLWQEIRGRSLTAFPDTLLFIYRSAVRPLKDVGSSCRATTLPRDREVAMKTVKDVLNAKVKQISSIAPDATVFEALKLMAEKEVGALLVMEGDRLIGVLSERDYARKVIIQGKSSKETSVREIMSEKVMVVNPANTIEECMALMTEKYVRHLPVVENGKVTGVVSIGDVVKSIISEQHFIIDNLVKYITGS
jgi:CBS domain-containing protein